MVTYLFDLAFTSVRIKITDAIPPCHRPVSNILNKPKNIPARIFRKTFEQSLLNCIINYSGIDFLLIIYAYQKTLSYLIYQFR